MEIHQVDTTWQWFAEVFIFWPLECEHISCTSKYYVVNSCPSFLPDILLHNFIQVVWAVSAKLGCAFSTCESLANGGRFYACNYGPSGNIGDFSRPYELPLEQGAECEACEKSCAMELGICGKWSGWALYGTGDDVLSWPAIINFVLDVIIRIEQQHCQYEDMRVLE